MGLHQRFLMIVFNAADAGFCILKPSNSKVGKHALLGYILRAEIEYTPVTVWYIDHHNHPSCGDILCQSPFLFLASSADSAFLPRNVCVYAEGHRSLRALSRSFGFAFDIRVFCRGKYSGDMIHRSPDMFHFIRHRRMKTPPLENGRSNDQ